MNLGPDAPTVENAAGGKGSDVRCRVDLIDARALLHIGSILDASSKKYGVGNWRKVSMQDHINHAMVHQLALLAGDTQDDHLGHAALRMLMALAVGLSAPLNSDWQEIEQ